MKGYFVRIITEYCENQGCSERVVLKEAYQKLPDSWMKFIVLNPDGEQMLNITLCPECSKEKSDFLVMGNVPKIRTVPSIKIRRVKK